MHDISSLTYFNSLRPPGFSKPVSDRFSTVLHERGHLEIIQDPRGIAVQLSTNEGTCQLVGNNFPMFFICNSIRFLDTVYSFVPKSQNHIQDNWRIIDFPSLHPDSFHMFKLLFYDVGCPQDYKYMEDNRSCWICQYILTAGLEGSAVPSDSIIIVLLEEMGTNVWCKGSFQRGIYTVEMDVMKGKMHSLLKSPGQLSELSTILKVFNDFLFVKPDGQHHLPELTNLAKLSFNAKAAVKEKHCLLAYKERAVYRGANIGILQRKLQWEGNVGEKTLMVLDDMWSHSVVDQLSFKSMPGCQALMVSRVTFPTIFNLSYERKLLKNIEAMASFWYLTSRWKPVPTPANDTVFAILIESSGQQLCSLMEIAWPGDLYSSYLDMYATRHGALRALALYWSNEGNINLRKHVLVPQRERALLTEWEGTTD
ncbi:hypothetical protein Nepgr_032690 [Nepenthes gracilis]|uniref:catalase n=1 Tax=Nepenthes gracilis TaxID=150966 RepID=A0AAD3TJX9_NEPGR|nr:hypothetical protein Nepgr_032690 [Nepenthes gracilis]